MIFKGKCSIFGGPYDSGMRPDEGLSLYEHHEADKRPDLFYPPSLGSPLGTSKRLRETSFYFAYRYDHSIERSSLQTKAWILYNPSTEKACVCHLTDWGPHERTGRTFDISPGASVALGVSTDQEIYGCPVSELKRVFES